MSKPTIEMTLANEAAMMLADANQANSDKKIFVHNLGILASQTREGVESVELADHNNACITFRGGYTKYVNIAMDSYAAIARDVFKHIT